MPSHYKAGGYGLSLPENRFGREGRPNLYNGIGSFIALDELLPCFFILDPR